MLKIDKAKAQLILDQPFFASMLYSMPFIQDNGQPTMATDGYSIRYNSEFVETLQVPEIVFVLAHEIMHCVMQHLGRRGSYDAKRWNVAADYVVNDILAADRVGTMPKGALHDSGLVARAKGTAEGVYGLLPSNPPEPDFGGDLSPEGKEGKSPQDGQGKPSDGQGDQEGQGQGDAASKAERAAKQKIDIINASRAAKACGKLSAGMERLVGEATKSKVDWREVMRRFFSERAKTDWSYARPKRRSFGDDSVILPSLAGERMGTVAIAIDCSGSIDDAMLAHFGAELKGILGDINPSKIEIIYFESKVCGAATFDNAEDVTLKAPGTGGTAFSPIWEYIEAKSLAPVACVVLTDLECYDYGQEPSYPVLWASTDPRNKAKFGETVSIERGK